MIEHINQILWGSDSPQIKPEIFKRWCQGFRFSQFEPVALQQSDGGPCALIAAVQAYILKDVLFVQNRDIASLVSDSSDLLLSALIQILEKVSANSDTRSLCFFHWSPPIDSSQPCFKNFLSGLRLFEAENSEDLCGIVISLAPDFCHDYAVLSFLYSVLATCKSFNDMIQISLDTGTLIDPTFGHSGQCLLNLLITGCMTPEVINGDFNLGGFIIRGITSQPDIGFLSIIEATMHCEVGWFLKNPAFPIWVIGSESHYTVLASTCRELVRKDEASSSQKASLTKAEMEFTSMCPAGDESGFFAIDRLPELLQKLNIVMSEAEYQDVKRELDPEELGLVLRNVFLNKFYPAEMAERRTVKIKFPLYHFNSLPLSNPEGKVKAIMGKAELIDPEEELQNPSLSAPSSELTDMLRCLRTKWPTIRIQWDLDNRSKYPSLH